MCQLQDSILSKINSQINLVLQLANQFEIQLRSTQFLGSNQPIIKNIQAIINCLSIIPLFNDLEFGKIEFKKISDFDFQRKTWSQIIGAVKLQKQNVLINLENYSEPQIQDPKIKQQTLKGTFIRGPYRSYGIDQKIKVIKLYKQGQKFSYISRLMNIPQKNIVRWCRNGVFRKQGAGRKVGDPEMQTNVLKWIRQQFKEGDQINPREIRKKAIKYSTNQQFKSSKGWLKNFIRRNSLNHFYDIK